VLRLACRWCASTTRFHRARIGGRRDVHGRNCTGATRSAPFARAAVFWVRCSRSSRAPGAQFGEGYGEPGFNSRKFGPAKPASIEVFTRSLTWPDPVVGERRIYRGVAVCHKRAQLRIAAGARMLRPSILLVAAALLIAAPVAGAQNDPAAS